MVARAAKRCFLLLASLVCCNGFVPPPCITPRSNLQFTLPAANRDDDHPTTSSRRHILGKSAAIVASVSLLAPQSAKADPSIISSIQGPIQDAIAPGHWIGQFLGLNSRQVTWDFKYPPERVSKALVEVLNGLTPQGRTSLLIPEFTISKADATQVHVLTWTKNEWLDALDVSLQPKAKNACTAKASFYATGFLPTSIPGAPLFNVGLAWFPFASPGPRGQMLQDYRLKQLETMVRENLAASEQIDRIATSIS